MDCNSGEICREIKEDENGGFYVAENHTIADIYRWLVKEGYWSEIETLHDLSLESSTCD